MSITEPRQVRERSIEARRPITVLPLARATPPTPAVSELEHHGLVHRARLLAFGGIAWHVVEFGIAVGAGLAASSIALVGFGIDSLIESAAGIAVLWRFSGGRVHRDSAERRAQQLIAASFFVLAAYVAVQSVRALAGGEHPQPSWIGIGLAAFTAATMPLLASAKRRVGRSIGSAATVKEGQQNQLCAYLSIALLVGLGANALLGWWWADPLAAIVVGGVALREGVQSWRGNGCCDAC